MSLVQVVIYHRCAGSIYFYQEQNPVKLFQFISSSVSDKRIPIL